MAELLHVSGVAGVDEAGRGPLAGPVVVAAVVLPDGFDLRGLNDSKKLSEAERDTLAQRIRKEAQFSMLEVTPERIDRLNILQATLWGMGEAIRSLKPLPPTALIDGLHVPLDVMVMCSPVVRGDGTYAAIAAASILAKTGRDQRMRELAKEYPDYGFERHFGYPTPEHLAILREKGPCAIHRQSFRPVREAALQPCLNVHD